MLQRLIGASSGRVFQCVPPRRFAKTTKDGSPISAATLIADAPRPRSAEPPQRHPDGNFVAFAFAQHHLAEPRPVGQALISTARVVLQTETRGRLRMETADRRAAEAGQRAQRERDEPIGALAVVR